VYFLPVSFLLGVIVVAIMYFGVEHVYGSGTEGQPGSFSRHSWNCCIVLCYVEFGVFSTVVWLFCDLWFQAKELLLWVLHFTTLLIEHSFSRHLYNSMEHLITLLSSCDMNVVLGVLNLLYMFSKRSNFITRLNNEKRQALLSRLTHLAEASIINCMAAYVIYHNCAHNHHL
jgi:uncharacterized membrane protein YqhA